MCRIYKTFHPILMFNKYTPDTQTSPRPKSDYTGTTNTARAAIPFARTQKTDVARKKHPNQIYIYTQKKTTWKRSSIKKHALLRRHRPRYRRNATSHTHTRLLCSDVLVKGKTICFLFVQGKDFIHAATKCVCVCELRGCNGRRRVAFACYLGHCVRIICVFWF